MWGETYIKRPTYSESEMLSDTSSTPESTNRFIPAPLGELMAAHRKKEEVKPY
jgi:hypothetical protein